jgi:hypothetical protein
MMIEEVVEDAVSVGPENAYGYVGGNPINRVDPLGLQAVEINAKDLAGVVYGETANISPKLKAGATLGRQENPADWDADSYKQLQQARAYIAMVRLNGGKTIKPTIPNAEELKNPLVQTIWTDAQNAANGAINAGKDPNINDEQKKALAECKHFVLWVSVDGKAPTDKPKIPADWPYTEKDKIYARFGPFRKTQKAGDVPISNDIYIFIYRGVK